MLTSIISLIVISSQSNGKTLSWPACLCQDPRWEKLLAAGAKEAKSRNAAARHLLQKRLSEIESPTGSAEAKPSAGPTAAASGSENTIPLTLAEQRLQDENNAFIGRSIADVLRIIKAGDYRRAAEVAEKDVAMTISGWDAPLSALRYDADVMAGDLQDARLTVASYAAKWFAQGRKGAPFEGFGPEAILLDALSGTVYPGERRYLLRDPLYSYAPEYPLPSGRDPKTIAALCCFWMAQDGEWSPDRALAEPVADYFIEKAFELDPGEPFFIFRAFQTWGFTPQTKTILRQEDIALERLRNSPVAHRKLYSRLQEGRNRDAAKLGKLGKPAVSIPYGGSAASRGG